VSIETLRKLFAAKQRVYWHMNEDKINKIIGWIEAIPNWQEDDDLRYYHKVCQKDKQ